MSNQTADCHEERYLFFSYSDNAACLPLGWKNGENVMNGYIKIAYTNLP